MLCHTPLRGIHTKKNTHTQPSHQVLKLDISYYICPAKSPIYLYYLTHIGYEYTHTHYIYIYINYRFPSPFPIFTTTYIPPTFPLPCRTCRVPEVQLVSAKHQGALRKGAQLRHVQGLDLLPQLGHRGPGSSWIVQWKYFKWITGKYPLVN